MTSKVWPLTGMGETFYSALGVAADATADAIKTAYRDRVKESHPDVSDDPDAPRQFKRLTTARDVLTDESERARYDRLGHETYVTRHVETSVWSIDEGGRAGTGGDSGSDRPGGRSRGHSRSGVGRSGGGPSGSGPSRDGSRSRRGGPGGRAGNRRSGGRTTASDAGSGSRRSRAGGDDRSTWLGEDWDGPRDRADRSGRSNDDTRGNRWVGSPGWSQRDSDRREDSAGSTRDGAGSRSDDAEGAARQSGRARDASGRTGEATRRPGPGAEATDGGPDPAAGKANVAGAGYGGSGGAAGTPGSADGRSSGVDGGVGQPWQQASATYRYSPSSTPAETGSPWRALGRNLRTLGPWLVIHVVLFLGALAMAWYMYVGTAEMAALSLPAVTFGVLLVALVVFLSVLHIVSLLYA